MKAIAPTIPGLVVPVAYQLRRLLTDADARETSAPHDATIASVDDDVAEGVRQSRL